MFFNLYRRPWRFALVSLFAQAIQCTWAAEQQMAQMGVVRVAGGQLKECAVGYRTYGTLAPDKSNVLLFPTWAGAHSVNLENWIGPGRLADSSKWYVIALDALGNGVSCSPSNSRLSPYRKFPAYTVLDMVRFQHKLLALDLGIDHVHGIIGIGMGGMQALQWGVTYGDFADRLVLLGTSAQPSELDRKRWDSQLRVMEAGGQPAIGTIDSYRQLQAVRAFDLVGSGDIETLAKKLKARILVISSVKDSWVETKSARLLAAKDQGSSYLLIDSLCGPPAASCEGSEATAAVAAFLARR